jgi:hypothetical protein
MNGTPAAPPIPKDYFLGFSFGLDRQATMNLVLLAQHVVSLNAKSITICIPWRARCLLPQRTRLGSV